MNNTMKDGVVDLTELYRFREEFDELPHRTKDSETFNKYRDKYLKLTAKVPNSPGWYIWYDSKNKEVIYVGKAGDLRDRLNGELNEEYHIFWMKSSNDRNIIDEMKKLYDHKYDIKIERDAKKYPADRIFWISPEGLMDTLSIVEMKLINKYEDEGKTPKANTVKKDYRKIESRLFEKLETLVEKHFKKM